MDSLLNELLKNGILDETVICKIKEMENQEYLKKHRYKIYQNKDGRLVTYLPDRKRIQRKDRAELEKLIVSYYKNNASDPTKTVYGYVPVGVVDEMLEKHGGITAYRSQHSEKVVKITDGKTSGRFPWG